MSFRVEIKTHKLYKKLTSIQRKEVNYKFNKWIKAILLKVK
jgi:hypothetical protein